MRFRDPRSVVTSAVDPEFIPRFSCAFQDRFRTTTDLRVPHQCRQYSRYPELRNCRHSQGRLSAAVRCWSQSSRSSSEIHAGDRSTHADEVGEATPESICEPNEIWHTFPTT